MCGRIQVDSMCECRISRPLFCHRSHPTDTYPTGRPRGDRIPCPGMDAMMRDVEYRHEHWCCSRQCCEEDIRYALGLQRRVQQLYAAGEKSARDLEDAVEEVAAAIERHDECQEMRDDLFAADG